MEQPPEAESPESTSKIKQVLAFIGRLNWFISASVALLAFFLLKRYVIDIEKVNARDMQSTFFLNDAMVITKTNGSLITNDIVYFEYPFQDSTGAKTFMFQRIYGQPGDSLAIHSKVVQINGLNLTDTATVKHNYFVKSLVKLDTAFKRRHALTEGGEISDKFDYCFALTIKEAELLRRNLLIKSVELKIEKQNNYSQLCFPFSPHFKWNMDHYGKIYVPGINDTIGLDTANLALYQTIITGHEKNHLEVRADSIFINNQYTRTYVIKKNYYFVLGDDRDNCNDSRVWGFLPENYIIGKVRKRIKKGE